MAGTSKYSFPKAKRVQVFEQVETYIENNYSTDENSRRQITELRQLVNQLQQTHQPTTEDEAIEVLDVEFHEIQKANLNRWQKLQHQLHLLKRQLLNPKQQLTAGKATLSEIAKHYLEDSVVAKALITYLDTLSADTEQE